MKLKRMLTLCVMLMVILFTMSGCMALHYTVEITEDGGTLTQKVLLAEEAKTFFEDSINRSRAEANPDTTEAAGETEEVEIYEIDGDRFYSAPICTDSCDSQEALAARLNALSLQETLFLMYAQGGDVDEEEMEATLAMIGIEEELLYILRDVRIETNAFSGEVTVSGYIISYQESDEVLPVVLDLKFPGEILEHSVGKKTDNNTLQVVLTEYWTEGTDTAFSVRAKLPGANGWIFAVLAVLVGAAMPCFVIWRKRRGQKGQATAEETAQEEAAQATEEAGSEEQAEQTPGEEPEQSVQSE